MECRANNSFSLSPSRRVSASLRHGFAAFPCHPLYASTRFLGSRSYSLPVSVSIHSPPPRSLFIALMVWLALSVSVVGCGYHFPGSGKAPGNIHTVAVEVLQNQTAEIGIETQFTNAIIGEFVRWKRLQIKPRGEADAVLGGRVSNIRTQAIVHLGPQKTLETRVTVTLQITLKRSENGEILWQKQDLSYFDDYEQSSDPLTTSRNRREAIEEIALFLAEKVHNDIFEEF